MNVKTSKLVTIAILLLIGIVIYFTFSPQESEFFPQCPFHSLTGLDCPGCGSQRAIHSLLHLQFKEAFVYNSLLIISIPYIFFGIYMEYFGGKEKYPKTRKRLMGRSAIITIFILILLFWIFRNIDKYTDLI